LEPIVDPNEFDDWVSNAWIDSAKEMLEKWGQDVKAHKKFPGDIDYQLNAFVSEMAMHVESFRDKNLNKYRDALLKFADSVVASY